MEVLPTQYLTRAFPPTSPDQFVGPARHAAESLVKIIASSKQHGLAPIKLMYSGPSGTGKTSLCYFAEHLLGVSRWALQEFNGTDVTIDTVRDIAMNLHLSHNDIFGDYRLIEIHEADRIPDAAQVRWLTVMDNLPPRTAVICTSNAGAKDLEKRFHRRFNYAAIGGATVDELVELVMRWPIPESIARPIAIGAGGSAALALQEAEEWLQTAADCVAA